MISLRRLAGEVESSPTFSSTNREAVLNVKGDPPVSFRASFDDGGRARDMKDSVHVCAYCGIATDLTKEHIFPDCIHKKSPGGGTISIAHTPQGDKAVDAPVQIKDVCFLCNNQKLSRLDTYICVLHDQYFKTIVHSGDRIDFRFDFDLLLRWLLKTMYNTSRSRGWEFKRDVELLKYILGEVPRPPIFRVFLQLIVPTQTSSLEWRMRPQAKEISPMGGSSNNLDVSKVVGFVQGYRVSLNSYFFHIFREDEKVSSRLRESGFRAIVKETRGACELSDRNRAIVFSSSLDYMTYLKANPLLIPQIELAKQLSRQLKQKKTAK
jgi:hypothetical protein